MIKIMEHHKRDQQCPPLGWVRSRLFAHGGGGADRALVWNVGVFGMSTKHQVAAMNYKLVYGSNSGG